MPASTVQPTAEISIEEMEHDLPAYLRRIEAGEAFVLLKAGKPVAEIKPRTETSSAVRPYALAAGEFVVPDDFDAPLPESVIKDFEGE